MHGFFKDLAQNQKAAVAQKQKHMGQANTNILDHIKHSFNNQ